MRLIYLILFILCGCEKEQAKPVFEKVITYIGPAPQVVQQKPSAEKVDKAPDIIIAARKQIGVTVSYDPEYRRLEYPGGDVPKNTGVCTDVIIRALRISHQIDLQKLVHEDMKRAFAKYPKIWGLSRPDKNIDHRRVPNLQCFFKRKGYQIKTGKVGADFKAGDIVTCMVGNRPHIMLVSNRKLKGVPLVIHNIGSGAKEDNSLLSFKLTGQYRIYK